VTCTVRVTLPVTVIPDIVLSLLRAMVAR